MGYVYAFSNASMPGIIKIGMTERSPEERLSEANMPDTFRPPTPYVIEMYKQIENYKETERKIHMIISDKRINPKREFFTITINDVKEIFDNLEETYTDSKIEYNTPTLETDAITKINNDIFDVLKKIRINYIYFDTNTIKINHEEKKYEYDYHKSDNLVNIINIMLTVNSHIFGNDFIEFYVSEFIRKNEGKVIYLSDIRKHFVEWSVNFTPMNKYNYYYIKNKTYNYAYFTKLKQYLSKNYEYDSVKEKWNDIEFNEVYPIKMYETEYNIIEYYNEDIKTLIELQKECQIQIGNKTVSLRKYVQSKLKIEP